MRHGYINDVRDVFRTAIEALSQDNPNSYESERFRLLKLQRDVIADLFRMHRVEKAMQDPPRKDNRSNWRERGNNRDNDEYEYEDEASNNNNTR